MKSTNFIFLLLFPLISFSQSFSLNGGFSGENTDKIILRYLDIDGNYVEDTLRIDNCKFQASGKIKGIQKVFVIGKIQDNRMEDPNLGYFFMGPGNTKIQLEEDHFKDIKVSNSATQKEFEKVNRKSLEIHHQIDSLLEVSRKDLVREKLNEIKNLELEYATKHPESPLSAYYINFYQRRISSDSLINYYESLSSESRQTIYGNAIKELIDKELIDSGDDAPKFDITDLNGKKLTLESFHGKYLLIDFWAGWCIPCIKKIPDVKTLINKYNNQDLKVLFISFDKSKDGWKKAVKRHNLSNWYNSFIGADNIKSKETLSYKLDIQPIPAYILIGPNGKVIGRYANASKEGKTIDDLANKLKILMKQ